MLYFQCRGYGFYPWSRNEDPTGYGIIGGLVKQESCLFTVRNESTEVYPCYVKKQTEPTY